MKYLVNNLVEDRIEIVTAKNKLDVLIWILKKYEDTIDIDDLLDNYLEIRVTPFDDSKIIEINDDE